KPIKETNSKVTNEETNSEREATDERASGKIGATKEETSNKKLNKDTVTDNRVSRTDDFRRHVPEKNPILPPILPPIVYPRGRNFESDALTRNIINLNKRVNEFRDIYEKAIRAHRRAIGPPILDISTAN